MKVFCDFRFLPWKRIINLFLVVAGLQVLSCTADLRPEGYERLSEIQNEKLVKLLGDLNAGDRVTGTLLIIPTRGCVACIDGALNFASQHQGNKNLSVILSTFSAKGSTLKLKQYNIDEQWVIRDDKALAMKYDLITMYPLLLRFCSNNQTYFMELKAGKLGTIEDILKSE